MHRSRLAGFIIDCKGDRTDAAARFWSDALGMKMVPAQDDKYVELDAKARDLRIEVQRVAHESRVHVDIESEDVEAEVARLVGLGAREIERVHTWVVLEAPTGQRFCVVRARRSLEGEPGATPWP